MLRSAILRLFKKKALKLLKIWEFKQRPLCIEKIQSQRKARNFLRPFLGLKRPSCRDLFKDPDPVVFFRTEGAE